MYTIGNENVILTAFTKSTIMSEGSHSNCKKLKLYTGFIDYIVVFHSGPFTDSDPFGIFNLHYMVVKYEIKVITKLPY
jgi:hypothetical protein